MWLTDLANGAFGGALVAATALLVQKKFENDRAREERQHADARGEQERKEVAEKEQRDYQRKMYEAWREERKTAHTQALSALSEIVDSAGNGITLLRGRSVANKMRRAEGLEAELLTGVLPWDGGAMSKRLWEKINTVALIGSPQSSQAAWAAHESATALSNFIGMMQWKFGISEEEEGEMFKQRDECQTVVNRYLAAAKADLGTDS